MKLLVLTPEPVNADLPGRPDPVFSHPEGERDYRENEGITELEARYGIPITHAEIGR